MRHPIPMFADFSAKREKIQDLIARLQRERLRLLSGVAGERFTSGIDTQLLGAPRAELVLRQHSKHRFADYLFWTALHQRPDGDFLQASGPAAVVPVHFLIHLVSGQLHSFGVDDHDMIAAIEKWRIGRFILANQKSRYACRQAPEHLSVRVNHEPILAYR